MSNTLWAGFVKYDYVLSDDYRGAFGKLSQLYPSVCVNIHPKRASVIIGLDIILFHETGPMFQCTIITLYRLLFIRTNLSEQRASILGKKSQNNLWISKNGIY